MITGVLAGPQREDGGCIESVTAIRLNPRSRRILEVTILYSNSLANVSLEYHV